MKKKKAKNAELKSKLNQNKSDTTTQKRKARADSDDKLNLTAQKKPLRSQASPSTTKYNENTYKRQEPTKTSTTSKPPRQGTQ